MTTLSVPGVHSNDYLDSTLSEIRFPQGENVASHVAARSFQGSATSLPVNAVMYSA